MFVSEFFKLKDKELELFVTKGVFDALIDKDSNFYINIKRLKNSSIPEFKDAYRHLNSFFDNIATLLDAAEEPSVNDKMYRSALNKFQFHEVNGINLGFASSNHGAGWGQTTSEHFLKDAYQIVKNGSKQPEIFHLAGLFEENVGGDRISDMIATIIEPDIKKYTLRIMSELNVTAKTHKELSFLTDGLIRNPYKNVAILLLPEEILDELPIARNWDDIDRVVSENDAIRAEINSEIADDWDKWNSTRKKSFLLHNIFMEPDVCQRVVSGYLNEELSEYSIKQNSEYLAEVLLRKIKSLVDFKAIKPYPTSYEAMMEIVEIYKNYVENNKGWEDVQNAPSNKREKAIQRSIFLCAQYYVQVNNIDLSCEPNEGRGPVDFKTSRGNDKTVAEVKLSTNNKYLHGYATQIQEYAAAEQTTNMVFVYLDLGNELKLKRLVELHKKDLLEGKKCSELVVIDARPRNAASTYENETDLSSLDFDIEL